MGIHRDNGKENGNYYKVRTTTAYSQGAKQTHLPLHPSTHPYPNGPRTQIIGF